ncbi:predicted protein [Botrytis cinerea T4]|uniref:Uncharacterized protein n=1 Tax=Botryotinia fuckeliana (strain T4) TaxID=999810 RepID=G2YC32_BOTF4|nr:predicted protein [Botrytis cinerea T4]
MIVSRPEFQAEHRPQRGKCKQAPRSRLPNVTLQMHDPGGAMLSVAGRRGTCVTFMGSGITQLISNEASKNQPGTCAGHHNWFMGFITSPILGMSFPARPYPVTSK